MILEYCDTGNSINKGPIMKYVSRIIQSAVLLLSINAYSGDFNKFSNLSEENKLKYDDAFNAQFKIKLSDDSRCTGTYISNEGHGLTAAHCVANCMTDPSDLVHWPIEGLFERITVAANGAIATSLTESTHKVTAYSWSYPKMCTAVINGESKEIQILAGAKGRHSAHMPIDVVYYFKQYYFITDEEVEAYKVNWLETFFDGWGMGADFAIFKVLDDTDNTTDCLKISDANEFAGNHYSLSYPGKTSIESSEINEELYLSTGEVTQGNYFNSKVITVEDTEHRYLNSDLWGSISGVWSAVVGREGMSGNELKDGRFLSSKVIREFAGDVLKNVKCD